MKHSYSLCSSLRETGGRKESFRNEVFHLMSCIPQNEMVVLAADMNGHVGSSNFGMVVLGMEVGMQMDPGS